MCPKLGQVLHKNQNLTTTVRIVNANHSPSIKSNLVRQYRLPIHNTERVERSLMYCTKTCRQIQGQFCLELLTTVFVWHYLQFLPSILQYNTSNRLFATSDQLRRVGLALFIWFNYSISDALLKSVTAHSGWWNHSQNSQNKQQKQQNYFTKTNVMGVACLRLDTSEACWLY